jgi:hypothetical protein
MTRLIVTRRVAVLALIGSALLVASAAAAAPATRFVSKQYGYSIVLAGGSSSWMSSYAFVAWSTGSVEPGSPAFDTFTDLRADRDYLVAARRRPTGSTLEKWTTSFISSSEWGCRTHSLSNSTLSGSPARVFTYTCSDVPYGIGITALHNHLGYLMLVASRGSTSRASDRSAFEAAQRSFRFLTK